MLQQGLGEIDDHRTLADSHCRVLDVCCGMQPGTSRERARFRTRSVIGGARQESAGHRRSSGLHRSGALTGDQGAMRVHVEAMHKNMMRDMRLADPSPPINHEAVRAAVRPLPGVQSSVWSDRSNRQVMVGGGQYRNVHAIDRICRALEPLGDILSVAVDVQDVTATTSEGADTISRNGQLGAEERAMFQHKRQVDALDLKVRRVFRSQQRRPLAVAVGMPLIGLWRYQGRG
jgi:hypothetical protein